MKVLVTGGAGYIGSTVVNLLLDSQVQPVVLDSLVQGRAQFVEHCPLYVGDIADVQLLAAIFADHPDLQAVIHFAALIDVEESTRHPSLYYRENLLKATVFADHVLSRGVKQFIFSSTAAVYRGDEQESGLTETATAEPLSPYGRSKLMFEGVLADLSAQYGASAVALRYFNPVGADPAFRSGPYKKDPTHILGKLTTLAASGQGTFTINGDDYPTRDGTPVRDYIHVWDLAQAHLAALRFLDDAGTGMTIINVGSGTGVTVREFADAFLEVSGLNLEVKVGARRPGDNAGAYANTERAAQLLGWKPQLSTRQGIRDALRWSEKQNLK